ncbi:MAG TPA: AmmeMemoRadiSam system protein A [Candidatus Acidoferrales bacterium]|nr:AmmeMemoRadiSam system protein A [Candidatus Acidoferrales bacterium]
MEIAREALHAGVEGRESLQNPPSDAAPQSTGVFVTLRKRGRLRGCIGQVGAGQSLAQAIAHCAKAAALEDPRFNPVLPEELPEIEIEISALSPLQQIAPEQIEAGRHGLMVSRGSQRGLLLPQVATEMHWTARRFLEETCLKAGFDPNAWREPETEIQGFTAEVFSESEIHSEKLPGPGGRAKSRYSIST